MVKLGKRTRKFVASGHLAGTIKRRKEHAKINRSKKAAEAAAGGDGACICYACSVGARPGRLAQAAITIAMHALGESGGMPPASLRRRPLTAAAGRGPSSSCCCRGAATAA